MYCAYGDESRDEQGLYCYAVSAVYGHESDWEELRAPWEALLGGRVFHAAECEFGKGPEFGDLKPGEGRKLYGSLIQALCKSKLLLHVGVVNVPEYKAAFPSGLEHTPYLWVFGEMVHQMSELAAHSLPPETVKIVMDHNQEIQHSASAMYDLLLHSRDLPHKHLLFDEVGFACRRNLGVQVADLVAREGMKRLYSDIAPTVQRVRRSFSELRRNQKLSYRVIGKDVFEKKKEFIAKSSLADSARIEPYREWLRQRGLVDNLPNLVENLKQFPELWEDGPQAPR